MPFRRNLLAIDCHSRVFFLVLNQVPAVLDELSLFLRQLITGDDLRDVLANCAASHVNYVTHALCYDCPTRFVLRETIVTTWQFPPTDSEATEMDEWSSD
jgi:hypothetical protein